MTTDTKKQLRAEQTAFGTAVLDYPRHLRLDNTDILLKAIKAIV